MEAFDWRRAYRIAALIPLVGLAIAAALQHPTWDWHYPASITRGLLAYALVAVWLWVEIGRRSLGEVHRILWLAPLAYVGILWLMVLGPALARGRAAQVWKENAGTIGLRTLVHLIIGYACVALLHVVRRRLGESEGAG
jgi:hypothetical protein